MAQPELSVEVEVEELEVCLTCGRLLTDFECEEYGNQCETCYHASHFLCLNCTDWYEMADRHPRKPHLCEDCGDDEEADERSQAISKTYDRLETVLCKWHQRENLEKLAALLDAAKVIARTK